MDEQTKTALELALAVLGTIVTWITAFPHIALSSQILLGIILILIDVVILIDWLELLYKKHVKRVPFVDVKRLNSTDLDGIESAIKEGFEIEATVGSTVFLVKENY